MVHFFQAYPTTGGFSRTAVNDQGGAKTAFASIISVGLIVLTLLFLTPYFYSLPKAILAAVIMVAVFGLIDIKEVRYLWKSNRTDLFLLLATFIATLSLGIEKGIGVGVILSLIVVILKSTRPHVAVLANIHGTHFYRNIERFDTDVKLKEDILIVRFDAQLYFANTTFFKDKLEELVAEKGAPLKLIVIDCESMNTIDSTGVHTLIEVIDYYRDQAIEIALSGIKGPVRDALEKGGVMKVLGYENCFMSIQEAIDNYTSTQEGQQKPNKFGKYLRQTNR